MSKSVEQQATSLTEQLLNLTNTMGGEEKIARAIADTLMNDHRTIQQSYVRVMKMVTEIYAEEATTDGRNEAAKNYCQKVAESTETYYLPLI